jgi:DNA-binding IclR family transcriptional regulator
MEDKMEAMIEKKIQDVLEYIADKPTKNITLEDYNIMSSELRDIRFRKSQEFNKERMAGLMAMAFPSCAGDGNVK